MATRIVFLDCDGTLTKVKSSWEHLHRELDLWNENADEYQALFRQGHIDYHEFCRRDALLWKGFPLSEIESIVNNIPYQEDAGELVRLFKERGIRTVIISTGLSFLVDKVKRDLEIDRAFSNALGVVDGNLSGEITINVDYDKKGPIVRQVLREFGYAFDEACAIGDGEGDKGMFEQVAIPIGFNMNMASGAFPERTVYIDRLLEAKKVLGVM